jgi:2,3-bisphosphoglycerate-independent phosphoglycerate mutase
LRPRPIVLVVLDGLDDLPPEAWRGAPGAPPSALSELCSRHPHAWTQARGRPSDGALAYGTLGAGRAPATGAPQVDAAIAAGALECNDAVRAIIGRARELGGRLHLIGLVSDGGPHASTRHLFALIDAAKSARIRVVVHAMLDGRDVPPRTAPRYLAEVEERLAGGVGRIGTVCGRSFGMDRTGRWDRIQKAYRAIVAADTYRADSALAGTERSYDAGKADESVEPFVVFDYPGVSPVDTALHFNVTTDTTRALTRALASPRFEAFVRKAGRAPFAGRYASLVATEAESHALAAFAAAPLANTLGEVIARAGRRQLRCGEVEFVGGMTTHFNGGRVEPFALEEHAIGPEPWHAAHQAILAAEHDFVLVALGGRDSQATPPRTVAATLGAALEDLAAATQSAGGAMVVTAAASPAPIVFVGGRGGPARLRDPAEPMDVAPTLLGLLGLPLPSEMTGQSLLQE